MSDDSLRLHKCGPGDWLIFTYENGEMGCETERMFKFTALRSTDVILPIGVQDMLRNPNFTVTVIPLRSPPFIQ